MGYTDFQALKEQCTIEQVVSLLKLEMKPSNKQLRGPCPTCKSGGDRALVVTPERGVYYCFADSKGGDLIQLAAHIRKESPKDAAAFIAQSLSTVPQAKEAKQTSKSLQPLEHIEFEHEAVIAIGLDTDVAASLGIGYATKGVARGNVVIPVRDANGVLKGYVGVTELTFIPKDFQPSNIIPLKRA